MLLIPAIDIINGRCVRLTQGDYQQVQYYGDDLLVIAQRWIDAGAKRLHLVDLDGAKSGMPKNQQAILAVVKHFPTIEFEVGGGIRTQATIDDYFEQGVHSLVLGSIAYQQPAFVLQQIARWPNQFLIGLDVYSGSVRIGGWLDDTQQSCDQVLAPYIDSPFAGIIYTDISRDGVLKGANLADSAELALKYSSQVFASGGIADMEDIHQLRDYRHVLAGAIIGKAIYEGRIDLATAIAYLSEQR